MLVQLEVMRATLSGAQEVGQVIEVSPDEGKRMIESGQAKPVRKRKPENTSK